MFKTMNEARIPNSAVLVIRILSIWICFVLRAWNLEFKCNSQTLSHSLQRHHIPNSRSPVGLYSYSYPPRTVLLTFPLGGMLTLP